MRRALPLLLLLALIGPTALTRNSAAEEESDPMPAQADGETVALQLEALAQEVARQVDILKTRAAAGDTRGAEEARKTLEETRDHLAVLLPVDEPETRSGKSAVGDNLIASLLSDVRSALTLYSVEHDGLYPPRLEALATKYIRKIPALALPHHPHGAPTRLIDKLGDKEALQELKDSGGWLYVSDPTSPMYGSLLIDCTHQSGSGEEWYKL